MIKNRNHFIDNKIVKLCIISGMLLIGGTKIKANSANAITAEVARWRGNATAAYSIIHDDACGYGNYGIHENADTIAYNRGLVIGAGAIVKNCVDLVTTTDSLIWSKLETMIQHGHEMISHSWLHDDATMGNWGVQKDVIDSKATLEQNISGCEVTFFVFPYDNYNDEALNQLRNNGYLGARAGIAPNQDRRVNTEFDDFDPFRCNFDAFCLTQDASIYVSEVGNANTLKAYIDDAISKEGWALQEMHEVGSGTLWGYIRVPDYQSHMNYVQSKVDAGTVWNATPTNVARYIVTKDKCGTPSVTDNILTFSSPDEVDSRYATELTVLLTTTDNPNKLTATQNGITITVEKLGANSFSLDVDPTKGEVTLSGNTGISLKDFSKQNTKCVTLHSNKMKVKLPQGAYHVDLYSIAGQKIKTLASGYSSRVTEVIPIAFTMGSGYYIVKIQYSGGDVTQRIFIIE